MPSTEKEISEYDAKLNFDFISPKYANAINSPILAIIHV